MNVKKLIRSGRQVSILKTLRFNIHYFGIKKTLKFPAIVSKNYRLLSLKGEVLLDDYDKRGQLLLGFFGTDLFDSKYDRGIWRNSGKIIIHGKCALGHSSKVSNSGVLEFGKNFINSANCSIVCRKKILIGEDVLVSWNTLIMDTDMHKIYSNHDKSLLNYNDEIIIGNHVWICCNSLILKGAIIADDSVVAANSTITKKFKTSNVLLGGINSVLKDEIEWML